MSDFQYDLPPELTVTAEGPIRIVTLNRPDDLNAVNTPLHWAVANVWRQIALDYEARVVIVTGAGKAFSAGGDFGWISSFLEDPAARDDSIREAAQIIEEMLRFPMPVISAVNGPAIGLGCSIAICSDIVLMSEKSFLADPHVAVGLVAGDGGAAFWPLLTPIMRSREYLFTGDRIKPDVAVDLGLATRVVAPDRLMDEACTLAGKMAKIPPLALRETKRIVNHHLGRALAGTMQAGLEAELRSMQTPEHRERILALKPKDKS